MASEPTPLHRDQLALDETVIDDAELEAALETREKRKSSRDAVQKQYAEADAVAKGEIEKLELPEGSAVRVGRFRIARTSIPARSVAFEAKASSRLTIAAVGE